MEAKTLRIMITGASGFLGSHIADALTNAGHEVTIYDVVESPYLKPKQTMVVGNVLDRKLVFQTMKRVDAVFHLAAYINIDNVWDDPYELVKVNILGTTNVLEACRLNGIKRVVFASSIYADSRAGSLYRVSKATCEELIKEYHNSCNINYIILRFGTVYGTRSSKGNSVYNFIRSALVDKHIDFYGTGNEVREYINVKDVADICTGLLGNDYLNQTLVLAGMQRIKVTELLGMINEMLGNSITITHKTPTAKGSHYEQMATAYIPDVPKRIVPATYCDFGGGLIEIMEEVTNKEVCNESNSICKGGSND